MDADKARTDVGEVRSWQGVDQPGVSPLGDGWLHMTDLLTGTIRSVFICYWGLRLRAKRPLMVRS